MSRVEIYALSGMFMEVTAEALNFANFQHGMGHAFTRERDPLPGLSCSKGEVAMERRKHPRVQVEWLISFFAGPVSCKGRISGAGTVRNLSVGGCKVVTDTRVNPGMHLELHLYLPDHAMPVEIDLAAIRWSTGREVGLEFISIRPEEEARLQRFVNSACQDHGAATAVRRGHYVSKQPV